MLLSGHNGWGARSWAVLRLLIGAYLVVHFVGLLPWAGEVFSAQGMATSAVSPLFRVVPSPLWLSNTGWMATAWVGIGAAAGLLVGLGVKDRWAAALALWVLATLQAANPLILNPALPHVGWVLLAHTLVQQPPSLWRLVKDPASGAGWRLPSGVFLAGWTVMTVGYAYSAWTKLAAPSWLDGTALWYVLQNPLARDSWLREVLSAWPGLLKWATFAALGLGAVAPVALVSLRARPWVWLALLAMQLGLLTLVDFADLTWGMLVMTVWTFDPRWVRRAP